MGDRETRQRIDGDIDQKDLKQFLEIGLKIIYDLRKEGHEPADVRAYLKRELLITSKYNPKTM